MFAWKKRAFVPTLVAGIEATPLLSHLAGEFAAGVAAVCPPPHTDFLTAPAARRHLLCLALIFQTLDPVLVEKVLFGSLRKAIQDVMVAPPLGIERALGRIGETAWSEADYRLLILRLGEAGAAKVLNHHQVIEAKTVQAMSQLPAPFLANHQLVKDCSSGAAELLAEIRQALTRRDGEAAAEAEVERWGRSKTFADAIEAASLSLYPEPAPPPFAGTALLRPVATKAELVAAAAGYRNCLRNYLADTCDGTSAIYEWVEEPRAVIEIVHDHLVGWRLNQARLVGNATVLEPQRSKIIAELRAMGVDVGRSSHDYANMLTRAGMAEVYRPPTVEDDIVYYFGD